MIAQAGGLDPAKSSTSIAGLTAGDRHWQQGQGDAALCLGRVYVHSGGRIGLDFDYILGKDWSKFPANSFVIRHSDFEDEALTISTAGTSAAGRWDWSSAPQPASPRPRSP